MATLALVTAVVLVPRDSWTAYALFFMLIAALLAASRIPPPYVLKRSLVVLPFALMVGVFLPFFGGGSPVWSADIGNWHITVTREGLTLFGGMLAKSWLSVLALILLAATTTVTSLLKGLEQLRAPSIMVMLLSFMYRYLFVISDEAERLSMARNSRSFGGGVRLHARTLGYMAGTLFLRSYERGERIYGAMLARGFDGRIRSLEEPRMQTPDMVYVSIMLLAAAAIGLSPLFWRV